MRLRHWVVLTIVCLLLSASGRFSLAAPSSFPQAQAQTDGYIVRVAPGHVALPAWEPVYGQPGVFMVRDVPSRDDLKMAGIRLDSVEPNPVVQVEPSVKAEIELLINAVTPNDPRLAEQYSIPRMAVPNAWNITQGSGVIVAVIDSGVDFSHPDLAGKLLPGRDFVNNDNDANDDNGHGTHVSGIIGAATNNGQGVAGIGYNTRVLPVKALNYAGSGNHGQIASAIAWAVDNGARIINLSLGGSVGSQTLKDAIDTATARGVLVVCAAGNAGTSAPQYPAAYPNCLSVVATNGADTRASFSSYGDTVDISAPGVGILSTVRGGGYEAWDGTSMAAPNVAGVAALVASANPPLTGTQIRARLESTADNIGAAFYFGRGRVNAERAVSSGSSPLPTAVPTAPATPPANPGNDYVAQLHTLINQARAQNGLAPLRIDNRLSNAADFHNRWMRDNNCFSHNCPGEPPVITRMRNANYPALSGGENIGKGYTSPQHMMDGWMNSSGHRAAILNTVWPDIGCAYLRGQSGQAWDSWWTCGFARGSDAPQPTVIVPPTRQAPTPFATVTPLPIPTPIRTTTPIRTATPQPGATLPAGWWMFLTIPATAQTNSIRAAAYSEFCLGYLNRGVTCAYVGSPFALRITIDYDAAPWIAANRAYWAYFDPYQRYGVTAKWQRK